MGSGRPLSSASAWPAGVRAMVMTPTSGVPGATVPPSASASSWWPRQMPRKGRCISVTNCRMAAFSGTSQGWASSSQTSWGPPMTSMQS